MLVAMPDPTALGAFLRARREGLSPAEVGLSGSGRRRTPGLRREEVAALAGVSIDYLVRLEQGRDTHPSAAVLAAIADALRLSPDERHHLHKLTLLSTTPELCPTIEPPVREVSPTIRLLLDRLGPTPAFVKGPMYELLAWNATWERLAEPIGYLDDRDDPNVLRFIFLHPGARAALPDWDLVADEMVQALRAAAPRLGVEPRFAALLAELEGDTAFAERWRAHRVSRKRSRTKRVVHPTVGELRIDLEVLDLPDPADDRLVDQSLVVWLPADEATEEAIRRATGGGAALRAV